MELLIVLILLLPHLWIQKFSLAPCSQIPSIYVIPLRQATKFHIHIKQYEIRHIIYIISIQKQKTRSINTALPRASVFEQVLTRIVRQIVLLQLTVFVETISSWNPHHSCNMEVAELFFSLLWDAHFALVRLVVRIQYHSCGNVGWKVYVIQYANLIRRRKEGRKKELKNEHESTPRERSRLTVYQSLVQKAPSIPAAGQWLLPCVVTGDPLQGYHLTLTNIAQCINSTERRDCHHRYEA
jgi:hypothetical protein